MTSPPIIPPPASHTMHDSLCDAFETLIDDPTFGAALERAEAAFEAIAALELTADPIQYAERRERLEELDRVWRQASTALGAATLSLYRKAIEADLEPDLARSRERPRGLVAVGDEEAEEAEPTEAEPMEPEAAELERPEPAADATEPAEAAEPDEPAAALDETADEAPAEPPEAVAEEPDDEPAPEEEEEGPEPVPVTPQLLTLLQARLNGSTLGRGSHELTVRVDLLNELKSRIGTQRESLEGENAVASELGTLDRLTDDECQEHLWRLVPAEAQRITLGLLAARARRLQAEGGLEGDPTLDQVFRRMTHYNSTAQVGFVHGLARHHTPKFGATWERDVRHWERQLEKYLSPYLAAPSTRPTLSPGDAQREVEELVDAEPSKSVLTEKLRELINRGLQPDVRVSRLLASRVDDLDHRDLRALHKAVKAQIEADSEEAEAEANGSLNASWSGWSLTHGKNAIIVGGEPREEARARLRAWFGFESLEWVSSGGMRRVQSVARKVQTGSVDLVFVLVDFVSHSITDQLRPQIGEAIVVHVPSGYGASRLMQAVEQVVARL